MPPAITRIAIITGDHRAPDPTKRGGQYNEEDLVTHRAMVDAFESLPGYRFTILNEHDALLDRLRTAPPDLVVNFCDTGFRNVPMQELHIPAYLELLGVPYTGAPPAAMVICYDKAIVRLVAEALGAEVPREFFLSADAPLDNLPSFYPALIKPNAADGSVGISKDAVVRDDGEARVYLDWLRQTLPGRDALIQEFLPGTEYGIGVIGNPKTGLQFLPTLEVDYSGLPANLNPILSYESKAMPDSPYWSEIKFKRAAAVPDVERRMQEWVRHLFPRLGLRDYGRFDFRLAADGEPKLIEVNPNPAWANDGKLAFMASFAGLEYREMLRLILEAAIRRVENGGAASY